MLCRPRPASPAVPAEPRPPLEARPGWLRLEAPGSRWPGSAAAARPEPGRHQTRPGQPGWGRTERLVPAPNPP